MKHNDYIKRGYFGIGVSRIKTKNNVGTLWRSAHLFGASFMFTIGRRYKKQPSDTLNSRKHLPLFEYLTLDDFIGNRPYNCLVVGVEITDDAQDICGYRHPERAIYLLGPEDGSLTNEEVAACNSIIKIPSRFCLNVSVAASIVMYDRIAKVRMK